MSIGYYMKLGRTYDRAQPESFKHFTVERLKRIYRKLSEYMDALEYVVIHQDLLHGQAVAVVLEDDLRDLIEECEGYLIAGTEPDACQYSSFESRSLTVIEEAKELLARMNSMMVFPQASTPAEKPLG